ncbi:MAG: RHS repeat-associated core domain-containing protein [Brevundimonas sp.]|uniref:RHS repeat-associated core domain-containing protein n=1 Tax=Brevundimonas sp. TaxID=1871086 RepID=UPI00391AFF05
MNTGTFGYTGQMWLAEAGLWHYRARAYHPALGRFLQPDPIGYGDGLNLYAYVRNDPLNMVDPSGTFRGRIRQTTETCLEIDIPSRPDLPQDGPRGSCATDSSSTFISFRLTAWGGGQIGGGGRGAGRNGQSQVHAPHDYGLRDIICHSCDIDRVFRCLLLNPAPGVTGLTDPITDGHLSSVNVMGIVRGSVIHRVDSDRRTLRNITLP